MQAVWMTFFFLTFVSHGLCDRPKENCSRSNFDIDVIPKDHYHNWGLLIDKDGNTFLIDKNPLVDDDIHPLWDPDKEVEFWLYTRQNPVVNQFLFVNNPSTVQGSYFEKHTKTVFVIHGYQSSGTGQINVRIRDETLISHDWNVVVVDWSKGSKHYVYNTCKDRIVDVARVLAKLIDFLVEYDFISISDVVIVGHSLGAHTAGLAAKKVQTGKIPYIVALDPARPFFSVLQPEKRVDKDDADYVEVIHTNGILSKSSNSIGYLGLLDDIGHADFYPNWGVSQIGCGYWEDWFGVCSHSRAWEFFADSMTGQNRFLSTRCQDLDEIVGQKCITTGFSYMGGITKAKPSGVYYLSTNAAPPFSQS